MNRYWFLMLFLCLSFSGKVAAQKEFSCSKLDSIKIVTILREAKTDAGEQNRMLYFGKKFLGVPYVAHTLEEGDHEHLIINVHELDCTTFVETVFALYLCDKHDRRTLQDYCHFLETIRYRNGQMGDYTSRLHYFTWWGDDNEQLGLVKAISKPGIAPFTALQTINVNYMSVHPDLYKQLKLHPDFVPVILRFEQASNGQKYHYIPKSLLGGSRKQLADVHDGDIISIITNKPGLDTSHVGIVFWDGGKLHLMHASSLYKKVVMDTTTFYDYSQRQKAHLGIRVYRPL